MQLDFLGVGEAFDEELGNTSVLVHSESKLLVDCGYSIPPRFWARRLDCNFLDGIYLTHFHADHTFGLPALLTRAWEEGRTKPLTIIGQPGTREFVLDLLERGYPSVPSRFEFELCFEETTEPVIFNELALSFAETTHGLRNFAIRISDGVKHVAFSGDGASTEASRALFSNCHVIVHETFKLREESPGHGTATEVVEFSSSFENLQTIACVHVQRDERRAHANAFLEIGDKVTLPSPGDLIEV